MIAIMHHIDELIQFSFNQLWQTTCLLKMGYHLQSGNDCTLTGEGCQSSIAMFWSAYRWGLSPYFAFHIMRNTPFILIHCCSDSESVNLVNDLNFLEVGSLEKEWKCLHQIFSRLFRHLRDILCCIPAALVSLFHGSHSILNGTLAMHWSST